MRLGLLAKAGTGIMFWRLLMVMEAVISGIEFRGEIDEKKLSESMGDPVCNLTTSRVYRPLTYVTKGPGMGFYAGDVMIEDGDYVTIGGRGEDPAKDAVLYRVKFKNSGCLGPGP